MANRWNGRIATQTVAFRGTSVVGVLATSNTFPTFHAVDNARYWLSVTGGVSGTFSVVVNGLISGQTAILAGITSVGAAGQYVLFPIGYSNSGLAMTVPTVQNLSEMHRFDMVLPPANVQFIANTGTAGISANCTVHAVLHGGY